MYDDPDNYPDEGSSLNKPTVTGCGIRLSAIILLAVILCGVLATPVAVFYRWYNLNNAATPVPTVLESQGINRIAYITNDNQLATISPDGLNRRVLTDMSRSFEFPAWSPDGNYLAVIGGDSLFATADTDITANNRALEVLYQDPGEPPFYLYWSPDSRQVSFLTSNREGISLHVAQAGMGESTSKRLVTGQPLYWDWTPEGNEILFHSGSSGDDARLAFVETSSADSDGENIAEPGLFQAPGISPSNNYRSFAEIDSEGNSQLVIEGKEGTRQLTRRHLGQIAMSWSPVSDLLAYTSPEVETSAFYGPLYVADIVTGEGRLLGQETVIAFFWSPDGESIAYLTLPEQAPDSIQVSRPLTRPVVLSKPKNQHQELRLDLWIVNVGSGFRRRLITFEPTELFVRQFLPFFDQYALSHRLWSPDSSSLVLPMIDQGISYLYVIPVEGTAPIKVDQAAIGFWSHQ